MERQESVGYFRVVDEYIEFLSLMQVLSSFHEFEQNDSPDKSESNEDYSGTKRYQRLVAPTTRLVLSSQWGPLSISRDIVVVCREDIMLGDYGIRFSHALRRLEISSINRYSGADIETLGEE